jgi:hypothetical protein
MRVLLFVLVVTILGAGRGLFGPSSAVTASNLKEETYFAPDPDPALVRPPQAGQSFVCDPIANANVFDDQIKHRATVWTNQTTPQVAIHINEDGKNLLLARAMDIAAAQPEEFSITLNGNYYMSAEKHLTLGLASIIFDVRTMKMVWSFTGQGTLGGIKGESALFQCH